MPDSMLTKNKTFNKSNITFRKQWWWTYESANMHSWTTEDCTDGSHMLHGHRI